MKSASLRVSISLACALSLSGCAGFMHGGPMAKADLAATRGNSTTGFVMFHQTPNGMMVHARVSGLKPGQEHGFHIHEKGDCSSGDGMSAGGHFNPSASRHGAQHEDHHVGDLPSLKADANGAADMHFRLNGPTIGTGAADIVGRGLIVHAMPDDYKTQPTGNAGARLACAVITRVG